MVGTRVMTKGKNQITMIKILTDHRGFTNANLLGQAHAGWLVAHVGTVRQIIGAVLTHKQLKTKRWLIGHFAGGIKRATCRGGLGLQKLTNLTVGSVPIDWHIVIGGGIVLHRMGQTPQLIKLIVAPCA